jgi:hypothetical protein
MVDLSVMDVARRFIYCAGIVGAMIEYTFLRNHLSGSPLVLLTLSLVVFAVNVPTLIGFNVARFYDGD